MSYSRLRQNHTLRTMKSQLDSVTVDWELATTEAID